jgi:hypothetical protein
MSEQAGSRFQGSLLNPDELQLVSQSRFSNLYPVSQVGLSELQAWKTRVAAFQRQVIISPAIEQGNLFDVPNAQFYSDDIDPFALPQQNTEFWRWRFEDTGVAALYFVIDYACDLLLYVGETVKSNQRWKGEHDCKRYLMNYREVHYCHQIDSQLGIAFWPQAPNQRRPRQQLESALIRKWRSPFNKENWSFWGTPFVGGKD